MFRSSYHKSQFSTLVAWGLVATAGITLLTKPSMSQEGGADQSQPQELLLPQDDTPDPIVVEQHWVEEQFTGGQVRIRRQVNRRSDNSFFNHGQYIEFYQNGQKFVEGAYDNGRQDGEWTYWYPNGTKCKTVTFKKGLPEGNWEVAGEDGNLQQSRAFKNGKKHGTWKTFSEDGQVVLREQHYVDGKPDGKWVVRFPSGKVLREASFENGLQQGRMAEWNEEGVLMKELNFKEGKLDGRIMIRNASGREVVRQYRDGQIVLESSPSE